MLFMVIEKYKPGSAQSIYQRFREHGRMLPDGLVYLDSWVETNLERCYQLMQTDDRALLDEWASHWSDLVEFEFISVLSSREAAEKAAASGVDA